MVSLIIPTLNAGPSLGKLLAALKAQTARPDEIIIVDSASDDDTLKTAEDHGARTISVARESFDHGGTRTLAAMEAAGDMLVFMTQDALPADEHALKRLTRPIAERERTAAVFGRQRPHAGASTLSAHLRAFNYPDISYRRSLDDRAVHGIKCAFLSNAFAAYSKRVLEEIGWFKGDLILGEDTYAGAKILLAGYEIEYVSDAVVYHSHEYSISQEFKRYFDIGVFHATENWIIKEFGKAEKEGMRYIKSGISYLSGRRKYHLIPELLVRSGAKYLGYKLGRSHGSLPGNLARRLSMHRSWWEK